MATNDIKYVLNVQLADNTVTVEDKHDKIAVLVSAGMADFQRVVKKLLLTGFRVNTGLYNAVIQPTGVVDIGRRSG